MKCKAFGMVDRGGSWSRKVGDIGCTIGEERKVMMCETRVSHWFSVERYIYISCRAKVTRSLKDGMPSGDLLKCLPEHLLRSLMCCLPSTSQTPKHLPSTSQTF